MFKRSLLWSSTLALGLAGSGAALAQTPPAPAEAAAPQGGLDVIVITAQRQEESLQSAAIAVDVVSAEDLAVSGIHSSSELNQLVPSLTVQQAGGANTTYFVRGVGNFTQNGFSDPAIAFNLDGVYLGRPTSTVGAFYDLERIEVLKGPQGTLYGRNATAGAINVIPRRPELGDFYGDVAVGYGNYNALSLEAAVNVPLGDSAALRIAGNSIARDGYNDDGTQDEEGQAARVQLLIEPTDTLSVRLAADYAHQGGVGPGATLDGHYVLSRTPAPVNTFIPSGLPIDGGIHSPASLALFSTYVIGGAFTNPAPPRYPFQNNDYWGVNAEVNWETPLGELTVLPAYRESQLDFRFNGPSFQAGRVVELSTQSSIEARFQGERIGMFDWLVGAYYFDEEVDGLNSYNQYVITAYLDYVSQTKSTAFFGRATANLSDTFRLVLGARRTEDEKTMNGRATTLVQGCGPFPAPPGPPTFCFGGSSLPLALEYSDLTIRLPTAPGPFNRVQFGTNPNSYVFYSPLTVNKTPSYEKDTYRIAAEWDVGSDSLLYASFETGYRSGGFSLALGRETFEPETLDAFTIGSKNRFLDNSLQLNIELFQWNYENQQVSHFGADLVGNSNFFTENIGVTSIQGLDLEGQYLPFDNTLITFSTQYLDSSVDQFSFRQLDSGIGIITGCSATSVSDRNVNAIPGNDPEFIVNCAGKRGYNSPEWSVDLGLKQTVPLGSYDLVFNADTQYRSDTVNGFEYLPQQVNDAHWTSNLSVSLQSLDNGWSVTGYVRNLEDERQRTATQFSSSTSNSINTWYSAPRTYGVRASKAF